MSHLHDVIIIGGGPAGYTAALYASRAGLDTLVIERMSVGGQMALTDIIDNYPGFEEGIDGISLGMKMQASAERFGAVTEYNEVTSVDLLAEPKKITTLSGDFFARTVVIATGADPRRLGIDAEERFFGRGVHYCAHCDGRFYKGKTVAVVGGGNSAVSDALYLSNLASKVYLIHRRDSFRATRIYHEPLSRAENIKLVLNSTVTDCLSSDGRISGIEILDLKGNTTRVLESDALFVSIGRKPSTDIFKGIITLDDAGYIVSGEDTKTNIEGVYAVGDVRTKLLRQVVTAVADGAVAIHCAEEYIAAHK